MGWVAARGLLCLRAVRARLCVRAGKQVIVTHTCFLLFAQTRQLAPARRCHAAHRSVGVDNSHTRGTQQLPRRGSLKLWLGLLLHEQLAALQLRQQLGAVIQLPVPGAHLREHLCVLLGHGGM